MSSVSEVGNEMQGDKGMSGQNIGRQEDSDFTKHLKRVSEIVETWPKWEQTILGTASASPYSEESERPQKGKKSK